MSDDQFLGDPYDEQEQPLDSETFPLDEVIRQGIDAYMLEVHTWMPARVVKVRNNSFVDIEVQLKRVYVTGKEVKLPIMQNVMVQHYSGEGWYVKGPIAVGDLGRACFCERSLDNWVVSGGVVDPQDVRHHDLADPVFVPGLRPMSSPIAGDAADMVLKNADTTLTLTPSGYKIANASNELLAVLVGLVNTLISAKTLTAIGPQPFTADTIAALTQSLNKIQTLEG